MIRLGLASLIGLTIGLVLVILKFDWFTIGGWAVAIFWCFDSIWQSIK